MSVAEELNVMSLAARLGAAERERDALRAAVRTHREAMAAHRAATLAVNDRLSGTLLDDALDAVAAARAALKATREALFALVPE